MRLISYCSAEGEVRLGIMASGRALPATDLLRGGPATIEEPLLSGSQGVAALRAAGDLDRVERDGRPLADLRLLAPVPRPGKVVAIGRNCADHAAEEGASPRRHRSSSRSGPRL